MMYCWEIIVRKVNSYLQLFLLHDAVARLITIDQAYTRVTFYTFTLSQ